MSEDINVTDGTVLETLNNKVDLDGGNYVGSPLEDYVHKHCLNEKITNCLLEVPQRIKYDLTDGILTVKAGSVVIVPYGTDDLTSQYPVGSTFLNENFKVYDTQFADDKFFVWAEVQNGLSTIYDGSTTSANGMFFITISDNGLILSARSNVASGASGTAVTYYNTTTNKLTHNQTGTISLPILECTYGTSVTNSFAINNVFNGVGKIGSTIWVDKGVKGLIPNYRNADGSLNNIEFTTDKILTSTNTTYEYFPDIFLNSGLTLYNTKFLGDFDNPPAVVDYSTYYNSFENLMYASTDSGEWIKQDVFKLGKVNGTTNITSFNYKQPFRAVDYNDKSEISSWGMPSNKYIDLTFGASGSSYTAPANGYFCAVATAGAENNYIDLRNLTANGMGTLTVGGTGAQGLRTFVPVLKGQTVSLQYSSSLGSNRALFFVYAEGEV